MTHVYHSHSPNGNTVLLDTLLVLLFYHSLSPKGKSIFPWHSFYDTFTLYHIFSSTWKNTHNQTDTHLLFYHLLVPIRKTAFHEPCLLCYNLLSPNRKTASHETFSGTHVYCIITCSSLPFPDTFISLPKQLFSALAGKQLSVTHCFTTYSAPTGKPL